MITFMICSLAVALATIEETCGEKVKSGSKTTPRILGFFSKGTGALLMVTDG